MSALTYIVYPSRRPLGRQKWRWRCTSANHKKLAHGGEAYVNEADCLRAVNLIRGAGSTDSTVEVRR